MSHAHDENCTLSTYEGEGAARHLVVYRGRRAVLDWLNRVADLARERSGASPVSGTVGEAPVRAPAHLAPHPHPFMETPPASDTTRDDPAVVSE